MTDDPSPSYTIEDFSTVNRYIDRMAERHDAAIFEHRSRAWETYLRWGVAALAVVGLSAALIIWAWSALIAKPEPRIVEPRVIQPPEVKVVIDGSRITPSPTEVVRQSAEERLSAISSPSGTTSASPAIAPPVTEVLNFVIFREIPFARGKINEVSVGMQYDTASDKKPSSQWCYVTAPNPSGSRARVDLAHVFGQQRVEEPLTIAMARDLGVSVSDLQAAQSLCKFE